MTATLTSTTLMTQQNTPSELKSWQQKVECAHCHSIIWSKYAGEFVWCDCGAIAVDQTPHYSRWIGNSTDFIVKEQT